MLRLFALLVLAIGIAGKGFVPLDLPSDLDDGDSNEAPAHEKHLYEPEREVPWEKAAVQSKIKDDAIKNIIGRRHAQVNADGKNAIGQVSVESKVTSPDSTEQTEAVQAKEEETLCPSTFVYTLPSDLSQSSAPSGTLEGVFGEEMRVPGWAGGTYKTKEETLLEIFLYRLRVGKRCQQVSHPDIADLFIVPILPSADAATWETKCNDLINTDWQKALPFLEERTAAKHILIMPEPDDNGRIPCGKFWHYLPLELRAMTILASDIPSEKKMAELMPPSVKIVPRPTSVHWSSVFSTAQQTAPWADWQKTRPIFATFFGGVHGPEKFQRLRSHLRDNCDKDDKCEMIVRSDGHATEELRGELQHIMKSKRRSTFCLEPPGTTFARQSLVQSILSGCIPVIFDKQQDSLFQWHWGPWRKGSRVLLEVPRACYSSAEVSEECDIIAQLRTLSEKRVQAMQRKIAKGAHALQYALGDYEDDAFDITLREVRKAAKEDEARFPQQAQAEDVPPAPTSERTSFMSNSVSMAHDVQYL